MNGDDEVLEKLDAILVQVSATNGRVSRLEEEVFGDPRRQTDGLIRQVTANSEWRRSVETVLSLIKWVVAPSTVLTFLTVLAKAVT